jgi:hypothetical protein
MEVKGEEDDMMSWGNTWSALLRSLEAVRESTCHTDPSTSPPSEAAAPPALLYGKHIEVYE